MSNPSDSPEPPELTPEARALLGRARIFFLVSFGVLMVGFIVIVGVLVYRATQVGGGQGGNYVITELRMPAGAEIVSAVAADGKLTVTYRSRQMTFVRIIDARSGELISEVPVLSE